jgi:hypothetical protein
LLTDYLLSAAAWPPLAALVVEEAEEDPLAEHQGEANIVDKGEELHIPRALSYTTQGIQGKELKLEKLRRVNSTSLNSSANLKHELKFVYLSL